jgi:alpha-N-acetylglucosaminidase
MRTFLLLLFFATSCAIAGNDDAARGVIQRVVPKSASQFLCEVIPADQGRDVFEIESKAGKIVLRGNNGVSIAAAFNWYLKYAAQCECSECGDQLKLPAVLPPVKEKVRITATVPYRFMYNYCTFGYTMPWWDWPRWERELDWLAMNGINLPFILTGQEAVWINTLTQYGYTEQEIRRWLGSPAHFPWTFMQNMENFGGELPAAWVPQRVALAKKIIARARELGMNVTLQGYYGMVPPEFAKRHPGVKVLPQGKWAGGLKRPDMLDPTAPIFSKIAATFMAEQEKLFGCVGFYTADPFHEGGNAAGVDMTDCGRRVFAGMTAADPKAIWVKMCWQTDNAKLLADIPADRVIALDLWAENRPFWPKGAFNGKSWIWCLLHNFGGNSELNADLAHLSKTFPATLANPKKGKLVGLAFTPEGHCNAPVVYALMTEFVWRDQPVDLKEWLPQYLRRRYGADSAKAREAWDGLLATIYSVRYNFETPANSILAARPLRGNKARTYGNTNIPYDALELAPAWEALLAAAPECAASDAYRYDLADVTRQVLGDLSRRFYDRAQAALQKTDSAEFEKNKALFLDVLTDLDVVLGTRREFLLGVWLEDAKGWGTTPAEKKLYEWQARTIITTWDDKPGSDLNDYANRQWNGLVKDYYRMRWELYFNSQPLDQTAFLKSLASAENAWTTGTNAYPTEPVGDTVLIARQLFEKYRTALSETGWLRDATPEDFVGRWSYPAEGATFVREIKADGSTLLYRNGAVLDWSGYTWRFTGNGRIEMRRADGSVFGKHALRDKDTLLFIGESWGPAKRITQ